MTNAPSTDLASFRNPRPKIVVCPKPHNLSYLDVRMFWDGRRGRMEGGRGRAGNEFSVVQPFTYLVFQFLPNTGISRQSENKSLTFLPPFPDLRVLLGDRPKKKVRKLMKLINSLVLHFATALTTLLLNCENNFCFSIAILLLACVRLLHWKHAWSNYDVGCLTSTVCVVGSHHPGTLPRPSSNRIFSKFLWP